MEWGFLWKIAEKLLGPLGAWARDRYLRYAIRRDIRAGSGRKIHILIARLDDDTPADAHRTTIYDTIRQELKEAVELTTWPDSFSLGDGHEYDIERLAYVKAQKLLKSRNCDLLISGRIKGKDQEKTVLSLRFTVAEASGGEAESYKLTETFDLPADFVGDLGAAISARVAMGAAAAVKMSGHYLVPLMRASADRLGPIAGSLSPHFDPDTRGSLLFSYALVRGTIGEQAGSNDDLAAAIDAYREALKSYTRERVPLQWATTQNNLGTALATLGARESGTARLEEAVEAFRAALQEYARERVPLQWATTQNNLGNALATLGERESGTARLEEAVAAYRAALEEFTRERGPLQWAMTQNNLGNALQTLGARESGTTRLQEAVEAFRAALEVFEAAGASYYIAGTRGNLARAEALIAERKPTES